jgi:hypothetical protein
MKSQVLLSDRHLLANWLKSAVLGAVLALCAFPALAQGPAVFREVRLDLSGLPTGAVETRRDLGACLSQSLPLAFAGRINPSLRGAPVLIVRPTSIWLSAPFGGGGDDRSSMRYEAQSPDFMEGEAIIGAARIPLSVSGGSEAPSLAAPLQQAKRRTDNLCQSFAYWLARRV